MVVVEGRSFQESWKTLENYEKCTRHQFRESERGASPCHHTVRAVDGGRQRRALSGNRGVDDDPSRTPPTTPDLGSTKTADVECFSTFCMLG